MHELSLALEVCRMAVLAVRPAPAALIREVGVQVGDRANIEVGNFAFCLEALLAEPPFHQARPAIQRAAGAEFRLDYVEIEDDAGTAH